MDKRGMNDLRDGNDNTVYRFSRQTRYKLLAFVPFTTAVIATYSLGKTNVINAKHLECHHLPPKN